MEYNIEWYEMQAVNLFEQARSAITTAQYDNIKRELRKLIKDTFKAGRASKTKQN